MNFMHFFRHENHSKDINPLSAVGKTCTQCKKFKTLLAFRQTIGIPPEYDTICLDCRTKRPSTAERLMKPKIQKQITEAPHQEVLRPVAVAPVLAVADKAAHNRNKRCVCCKKLLPLSAFGVLRSAVDGKNQACKECRRAYMVKFYGKAPEVSAKNEPVNASNTVKELRAQLRQSIELEILQELVKERSQGE